MRSSPTGRRISSIRSWLPNHKDRRNCHGSRIYAHRYPRAQQKIEYLKFEEGTRFPEILSKQPHVAYKVDDMDPYIAQAQRVIFGPEVLSDTVRLAFVIHDDAIIELYEEK